MALETMRAMQRRGKSSGSTKAYNLDYHFGPRPIGESEHEKDNVRTEGIAQSAHTHRDLIRADQS